MKHNKLGEGERKVRLGLDSLPNIVISVAERSGNYIRCFTQTQLLVFFASFGDIEFEMAISVENFFVDP